MTIASSGLFFRRQHRSWHIAHVVHLDAPQRRYGSRRCHVDFHQGQALSERVGAVSRTPRPAWLPSASVGIFCSRQDDKSRPPCYQPPHEMDLYHHRFRGNRRHAGPLCDQGKESGRISASPVTSTSPASTTTRPKSFPSVGCSTRRNGSESMKGKTSSLQTIKFLAITIVTMIGMCIIFARWCNRHKLRGVFLTNYATDKLVNRQNSRL